MQPASHRQALWLSGRTDRAQQLDHVSLADGADNTLLGLNAGARAGGRRNTYVGANVAVDLRGTPAAANNVVVGAGAGERAADVSDSVFVGHRAGQRASVSRYDVVVGTSAGRDMSQTSENTLVGHRAGGQMVSGARNVLVGAYAGHYTASATDNVFAGASAGLNNRYGSLNVFLGSGAGASNLRGNTNVFLGGGTGARNTDGSDNVFLGSGAGANNTLGSNNIFLGVQCGANNLVGNNLVFLGHQAGQNNTNGDNNIFLGPGAGALNAGGSDNVFIGPRAGANNVSGSRLVFVGSLAGENNTDASDNLFMGAFSGQNNALGNNNVFLGPRAGRNNRSGNNNVFVGSRAGAMGNGSQNVGAGSGALTFVAGNLNVAVGEAAGQSMRGSNNAVVGAAAGASAVGNWNVASGAGAGRAMAGQYNAVAGADAGAAMVGSWNVAAGWDAATRLSGGYNTVSGKSAGNDMVGSRNVAVGADAATRMNGQYNTVSGESAGDTMVGDYNVAMGAGAARGMAGSRNVVVGALAGNAMTGSDSVLLGAQAMRRTGDLLQAGVAALVNTGTAGLKATSTVILATDSFNTDTTMVSSVVVGHTLVAAAGTVLTGSVLLGSGYAVSTQDSNKCVVGVGGVRALETTATSLVLGGTTDRYLVANTQAFVLGPDSRPFMNINRYAIAGRNLSRTFFPGSAYAMHRVGAWRNNALQQVADAIGTSITNAADIRPYATDAACRLPSSEWFEPLVPVYLASMGMQYLGYSFSDAMSADSDPLGAVLGLKPGLTSFGVEAWLYPTQPYNNGPVLGSMTVYGSDRRDWTLGFSNVSPVTGIATTGNLWLAFEYYRADNTRVLLRGNVELPLARWHHVAVNGSAVSPGLGQVFVLVNGTRVGIHDSTLPDPTVPVASHAVVSRRWESLGLRVGRRFDPQIKDFGDVLESSVAGYMAEIMFSIPLTGNASFVNALAGTYTMPTAARAEPPQPLAGVQLFINTVEETPALAVNNDMHKLHAVQLASMDLYPNRRGLKAQYQTGGSFPMPWSHPLARIRLYNGTHIQMSRMPLYLDRTGEHGLAINTSTNGTSRPQDGFETPFGSIAGTRVSGTFLFGNTGTLGCVLVGNTSVTGAVGVFGWDAGGVVAHGNLAVRGGGAANVMVANAGGVFLRSGATFNGSGAGLTGIPASSIVGVVATAPSGDATLGNVSIAGVLTSSKTGLVSGFAGGPLVTQRRWDAPGPAHTIEWPALAGGCDNVSGMLYLHVSSKMATYPFKKNGMAVVSVVKDADDPPDLLVTSFHRSPNLDQFDIGTSGVDITVATDGDCALCYTFIAAA